MLAKLTSKNQLTLPKAAVEAAGSPEYFEIEIRAGQLLLSPVSIQRANALRAKLAALKLADSDVADAVAWARSAAQRLPAARVNEPTADYSGTTPGKSMPRRPKPR